MRVSGLFVSLGRGRVLWRCVWLGLVAPTSASFLWQWTDVFLGTPPSSARRSTSTRDGEDPWAPAPLPGRNPLWSIKRSETPYFSVDRLRRIRTQYFPLVEKFVRLDDAQRRAQLAEWIPALSDAALEKKLKNAIKDQWDAGVAPGQQNDRRKLPRDDRVSQRDFFPVPAAAEDSYVKLSAEREQEIWRLENTFAWGYQLLRGCAVEEPAEEEESSYFHHYVLLEWTERFKNTQGWLELALRALEAARNMGGAKDSTEQAVEKEEDPAKRQVLVLRKQRSLDIALEDDPVLGGYRVDANGADTTPTDEPADHFVEAAVEVLWNRAGFVVDDDAVQRRAAYRLSRLPDEFKWKWHHLWRVRRKLIEEERQTEDLQINAAASMQDYQRSFFPVAFYINPLPIGGTRLWRELAEDLRERLLAVKEKLQQAEADQDDLVHAKAQELAGAAAAALTSASRGWEIVRGMLASGALEKGNAPPGIRDGPWRDEEAESGAQSLQNHARSACVRLFWWARRHQLHSRMLRWNIEHRLRVLRDNGAHPITSTSAADILEQEVPTAVGAIPQALPQNRNYTTLFFLLRDHAVRETEQNGKVVKSLDSIPPLSWNYFQRLAETNTDFVTATSYDVAYVPPWDPGWGTYYRNRVVNGTSSERAGPGTTGRRENGGGAPTCCAEADEDTVQTGFKLAVSGVAVFSVALAVVITLLVCECRKRAKLTGVRGATREERDLGRAEVRNRGKKGTGTRTRRRGVAAASQGQVHGQANTAPRQREEELWDGWGRDVKSRQGGAGAKPRAQRGEGRNRPQNAVVLDDDYVLDVQDTPAASAMIMQWQQDDIPVSHPSIRAESQYPSAYAPTPSILLDGHLLVLRENESTDGSPPTDMEKQLMRLPSQLRVGADGTSGRLSIHRSGWDEAGIASGRATVGELEYKDQRIIAELSLSSPNDVSTPVAGRKQGRRPLGGTQAEAGRGSLADSPVVSDGAAVLSESSALSESNATTLLVAKVSPTRYLPINSHN
eukprot:g5932.t1